MRQPRSSVKLPNEVRTRLKTIDEMAIQFHYRKTIHCTNGALWERCSRRDINVNEREKNNTKHSVKRNLKAAYVLCGTIARYKTKSRCSVLTSRKGTCYHVVHRWEDWLQTEVEARLITSCDACVTIWTEPSTLLHAEHQCNGRNKPLIHDEFRHKIWWQRKR